MKRYNGLLFMTPCSSSGTATDTDKAYPHNHSHNIKPGFVGMESTARL